MIINDAIFIATSYYEEAHKDKCSCMKHLIEIKHTVAQCGLAVPWWVGHNFHVDI